MAEEPESGLTPEREPGESEDAQTDWEAMLKWVAENPDPRIPLQEDQNILFAQVAKLILRWAEAPNLDTATAKYMRKRGSNDRAIVVNILERCRRKWGNDTDRQGRFLADCRLLASTNWNYDPAGLKVEVEDLDRAIKMLEKIRDGSKNKFVLDNINRTLNDLKLRRSPLEEYLKSINFKSKAKAWPAYYSASLACEIYERWIGLDVHHKRVGAAPPEFEEAGDNKYNGPGEGFPKFVHELFQILEFDTGWEEPTKAAVKAYRQQHDSVKTG